LIPAAPLQSWKHYGDLQSHNTYSRRLAAVSLSQMADILSQIVERKRERIAEARRRVPEAELRRRISRPDKIRPFESALKRDSINIIAEIKRRSPSRGLIRENFEPVSIARNYESAGAAAISILTEEDFFSGGLGDLRAVRAVSSIPLLRKDFIVDSYQLYESVEAGADAVLLIAAVLDDHLFAELLETAHGLGLDALVEIHDLEEAERVLRHGVRILGVNNRNLRSFETSLETSVDLAPHLQHLAASCTLVSESGIRTRGDIDRLRSAGFHAVLIGEELMKAADEGTALLQLIEG
jgi:indole-3-glycerol phosphate synthase